MSSQMSSGAIAPAGELAALRRRALPWWVTLWVQLYKTKPLATFGLAVLLFFVVIGLGSQWIAPERVNEPHLERIREELVPPNLHPQVVVPGPSWRHPFGLDKSGRDLFSRVIHGARVSLFVGLGSVALGVGAGGAVGIVSAWFGGKFDTAVQRLVDGVMTFPTLPVLITIVTLFPPKAPFDIVAPDVWAMLKIILAIGLLNIAWYSRIVRSAALVVKQSQYVDSARAVGAGGGRIVLKHILPNVMAPIITLATLGMGGAILAEASLSFLGYGIPAPNPSWGGMLSAGAPGSVRFFSTPWMAYFPGFAITISVLGINLLGDGLRDLLDPRLRGSQ